MKFFLAAQTGLLLGLIFAIGTANAMLIDPKFVDVKQYAVKVNLQAPDAIRTETIEAGLARGLAALIDKKLGGKFPVIVLNSVDDRLSEAGTLTVLMSATIAPAQSVIPGSAGYLMTLHVRGYRPEPEVPNLQLFSGGPFVVHATQASELANAAINGGVLERALQDATGF
jgi:hypothetical protein